MGIFFAITKNNCKFLNVILSYLNKVFLLRNMKQKNQHHIQIIENVIQEFTIIIGNDKKYSHGYVITK